jgi:hypothetical protein
MTDLAITFRRARRRVRAPSVPARGLSGRQIDFLATGVLPPVLIALVWATTGLASLNGGLENDGVFYYAMAHRGQASALLSHTAPFATRVLTPFIASLVPVRGLAAFAVVSAVSTWLTLALLYRILQRSGVSRAGSLTGVLLYAGVFWTVKVTAFSPALVDFQMQLFVVGIMYLIVRRWWWAIPGAVAAGVTQKETIIAMSLVAAVTYAAWERPSGRALAAYTTALLVPGLAVYAVLRATIVPLKSIPGGPGFMVWDARLWAHPNLWPRFGLAAISGLGVLPLVAAASVRRVRLREDAPWLAMTVVFTCLLFGGAEKSRLFLPIVPALVVIVGRIVDGPASDRSATRGWLALTLGVHSFLGGWLTPTGPFASFMRHIRPEFPVPLSATDVARVVLPLLVWAAVTIRLWSRLGLGRTLATTRTLRVPVAMTRAESAPAASGEKIA